MVFSLIDLILLDKNNALVTSVKLQRHQKNTPKWFLKSFLCKVSIMPKREIGVRGKPVASQGREIINNVVKFMYDEAKNGIKIPITQYRKRILAATGISQNTYNKIARESRKLISSSTAFSIRKARALDNVTPEQIKGVKSIIREFYVVEKRRPTLKAIYRKTIEKRLGFKGRYFTLKAVLKRIGFRWSKTVDYENDLLASPKQTVTVIDEQQHTLHKIEQVTVNEHWNKDDYKDVQIKQEYVPPNNVTDECLEVKLNIKEEHTPDNTEDEIKFMDDTNMISFADSDYQDIFENTPPNAKEAATLESLPVKSREKYELQYVHFIEWAVKNKTNEISENTLLAYFAEKSKVLKASTLWSYYSMLKATLAVKNNIQIDQYLKLIAFIKQKSVGFRPKISRTLSKSEMDLFLSEAPNDKFLMIKVALIIGVAGACRCDELCKMTVQHVEDKDTVIIVTIPGSKTKRERIFAITNGTTRNLDLYRKYLSLRPPEITHNRLFLSYRSGKCTVQPVGINTFSKIPSLIAKYLNLANPDLYTGHCFRRSSANIT